MAYMNYIELLNAFYERIQCSRVSNNGQLLYYTLLAINNKSSWSDWFSRTNVSISGMMGISEKAFMNARAELKQLGLIDFVPSKKRGECTKYRILYPTNYSTNGSTKEVQTTVQSTDINKHKTETKKSIPNGIQEKTPQEPKYSDDTFELRCVDRLSSALLSLFPGAKVPTTAAGRERWADEIERMKRLDGRSEEEIQEALEYAVTNSFWQSNIRSTAKLREKFETLLLQARRKPPDKDRTGKAPNRFHNLEEHGYDYDGMVWEMINAGGGNNDGGTGKND